ncbi:MAG: 50S ribosomal protein L23 [Candidatus Paceibacterota bacterium]|jgi:ribosomal protein L23
MTKNTIKKTEKESKEKEGSIKKTHPLIKGVRVTEKAALAAEKGAYTFNVEDNANKNEIKKAIKLIYGVMPERVAIIQIKEKKVVRRGKIGTKKGGKKAVVFLKKGDKITIA